MFCSNEQSLTASDLRARRDVPGGGRCRPGAHRLRRTVARVVRRPYDVGSARSHQAQEKEVVPCAELVFVGATLVAVIALSAVPALPLPQAAPEAGEDAAQPQPAEIRAAARRQRGPAALGSRR